jgi:hypothetical protein
VEKIVIISKQEDCNHGLIALINALFPECDISIIFSDMEGTLTDAKGGTMSDILIMHDQPNMHELLSQKLAGAVKPL